MKRISINKSSLLLWYLHKLEREDPVFQAQRDSWTGRYHLYKAEVNPASLEDLLF